MALTLNRRILCKFHIYENHLTSKQEGTFQKHYPLWNLMSEKKKVCQAIYAKQMTQNVHVLIYLCFTQLFQEISSIWFSLL